MKSLESPSLTRYRALLEGALMTTDKPHTTDTNKQHAQVEAHYITWPPQEENQPCIFIISIAYFPARERLEASWLAVSYPTLDLSLEGMRGLCPRLSMPLSRPFTARDLEPNCPSAHPGMAQHKPSISSRGICPKICR